MNFTTQNVRDSKGLENRKAERTARAKQMFAKAASITYLGTMTKEELTALTVENPTPDQKRVQDEYGKLSCAICGRMHNPDRAMFATFYRNDSDRSIFALSDTCRFEYLGPVVNKVLANPADYVAAFPPVKKR